MFKLSQGHYVQKIMEMHAMMDCKLTTTALDTSQYSHPTCELEPSTEETQKISSISVRQVIGQLLYLASHNQPGIAAAVSVLSRKFSKPRPVIVL